jgi:hypothetical protein
MAQAPVPFLFSRSKGAWGVRPEGKLISVKGGANRIRDVTAASHPLGHPLSTEHSRLCSCAHPLYKYFTIVPTLASRQGVHFASATAVLEPNKPCRSPCQIRIHVSHRPLSSPMRQHVEPGHAGIVPSRAKRRLADLLHAHLERRMGDVSPSLRRSKAQRCMYAVWLIRSAPPLFQAFSCPLSA